MASIGVVADVDRSRSTMDGIWFTVVPFLTFSTLNRYGTPLTTTYFFAQLRMTKTAGLVLSTTKKRYPNMMKPKFKIAALKVDSFLNRLV